MAKNRIIYAVFLAICLGFSMAYRSNFSAVLLITVVLYLPIAAILTAVSIFSAKIRFTDENYIGEKNMRFDIQVEVKNRFITPFVPLELLSVLPDGTKGVFEKRRIFVTLQPFGKTALLISCIHKYRGSYNAEITKAYAVDPLGIIRIGRKLDLKMSMTFFPRKFTVKNLFGNADGNAFFAHRTAKDAEREDFSHVRDYLDGDVLQLVHWKLTAKSDNIMIKEYESISDRKARIICDFDSCKMKKDVPLNFDTVIETALAFSRSLINANIGAEVDCGDISRDSSFYVSYSADYERLYDLMSIFPTDADVCSLEQMMGELREREQSIIIVITAKFTEQTAFMANSAANLGTVLVVYIDLENEPPEHDFSQDRFYIMNIQGTGSAALKKSAELFGEDLR